MTPEQQKKFKYWQTRTLIGTIIGYIFFYLVRKNFSFAMPGLTAEYGIDKGTLGLILTIAGVVYGVSKLINGILADRINGRWHMVVGLAMCALTSILFGLGAPIATFFTGESDGAAFVGVLVIVLSVLWIVNNIFQGCGFPPCSRLLPRWVPADQLATKMSIWNTSHSIGAALAGILCGVIIMGHMGNDHSDDMTWVERVATNLSKKHKIEVSAEELKSITGEEELKSDNFIDEWYTSRYGSDTLLNKAIRIVEARKGNSVISSSDSLILATLGNAEDILAQKDDTKSVVDGKLSDAIAAAKQVVYNRDSLLLHSLNKEKKYRRKDSPEEFKKQVEIKSGHVGAWQWAFLIPGIIAAIGVFVTAIILRDTPKSVGLPELNESKKDKKSESSESKEELSAYIREHVWKNPIIWALAVADFFVYVIRFAVLDWGPTFLQEEIGMTPGWAAWTVIIFEVFGVIGMFAAGVISDKVFGGRAARTCLFCMIGALLSIVGFIVLYQSGASSVALLFTLALGGAFIYGPQALIGVISSNHATSKGSASALGIIGFVSYISVGVSGWGFGLIADSKWGWNGVFVAMVVMAIIGAAIFVPMWKMKRDAYSDEQ